MSRLAFFFQPSDAVNHKMCYRQTSSGFLFVKVVHTINRRMKRTFGLHRCDFRISVMCRNAIHPLSLIQNRFPHPGTTRIPNTASGHGGILVESVKLLPPSRPPEHTDRASLKTQPLHSHQTSGSIPIWSPSLCFLDGWRQEQSEDGPPDVTRAPRLPAGPLPLLSERSEDRW